MSDDVMIAVDPHKASNTAAVLDPVTRTLIESARFANSADGYQQLAGFARRWDQRRWAVEGCHGAGRSVAQRLVADGEMVLDVPAKLAARVRVFSQGHGRKTDKDDAVSIGLAALDGDGVAAAAADGATVSLRLLCDRREELGALRTQAVCRLHRLLAELTPGGMSRELSAGKAAAVLDRIRPGDEVSRIRLQLAADHLADIRALDARIKTIGAQISRLVAASGTQLTALYGIGPVIAGRILAETGDVRRFATKDKFATCNGTAPIDVSSGEQVRHRLSRAGNQRINHALHMMASPRSATPQPPAGLTTSASGWKARHPRKRSGASSAACPTWSTTSSSLTSRAQSTRADHLRPTSRRGLHPAHRRPAHARQNQHPRRPARRRPGVRRPNRLVGIEVLDASSRLHDEFLNQAEAIG